MVSGSPKKKRSKGVRKAFRLRSKAFRDMQKERKLYNIDLTFWGALFMRIQFFKNLVRFSSVHALTALIQSWTYSMRGICLWPWAVFHCVPIRSKYRTSFNTVAPQRKEVSEYMRSGSQLIQWSCILLAMFFRPNIVKQSSHPQQLFVLKDLERESCFLWKCLQVISALCRAVLGVVEHWLKASRQQLQWPE